MEQISVIEYTELLKIGHKYLIHRGDGISRRYYKQVNFKTYDSTGIIFDS